MVRSRTIKMLVALVASMTVGTGILIWMETPPATPTVPVSLQAVRTEAAADMLAAVGKADVPLQYHKWDGGNVIVHDQGRRGRRLARGCHFLIGGPDNIGDGVVRPTERWLRQLDGDHIEVPGYSFNVNSVGICLLADFNQTRPTPRQWKALVDLIRALQLSCQIPAGQVYLHSELSHPGTPGRRFPAGEELRRQLIHSAGR